MRPASHLSLVSEPPPASLAGGPDPALAALRDELAELRAAVFVLGDCAARALPSSGSEVHVALQAAAHQLCMAERALADAGS